MLTVEQVHTLINQITTAQDRDDLLFQLEQAISDWRWEGKDELADELEMHLDGMN